MNYLLTKNSFRHVSWNGHPNHSIKCDYLATEHNIPAVLRVSVLFQEELGDNVMLRKLSECSRFQMNKTNPPHVQFFRKPVYTTMALLSFLGNQQLHVVVRKPEDRCTLLRFFVFST
jgi:hypothetical protein